MKAILEFSLPEESEDYSNAMEGSSFKFLLQDFDNLLRQKLKHEDRTDEINALLQELRDYLHESARERNITI